LPIRASPKLPVALPTESIDNRSENHWPETN
jgi:hypothetical protein